MSNKEKQPQKNQRAAWSILGPTGLEVEICTLSATAWRKRKGPGNQTTSSHKLANNCINKHF